MEADGALIGYAVGPDVELNSGALAAHHNILIRSALNGF